MKREITHECGTAGPVNCEYELPDQWLDYLMQQLRVFRNALPIHIQNFRPINRNIDDDADIRNYCQLQVPIDDIIEGAQKQLDFMRAESATREGVGGLDTRS